MGKRFKLLFFILSFATVSYANGHNNFFKETNKKVNLSLHFGCGA